MAEFEEKFIKPIVNASYPATLAALSLTVLSITGISFSSSSIFDSLKYTLLLASAAFILSAFSIFFYTIYPTRKKLWTSSAITFLADYHYLSWRLFCCSPYEMDTANGPPIFRSRIKLLERTK